MVLLNKIEEVFQIIPRINLAPLSPSEIRLAFDKHRTFNIVAMLKFSDIDTGINANISEKDITISSIEFNKDYYNLRLDGVNCVTLDSLITQYKLYQKKNKVREEFKAKIPFPFEVLKELLTQGSLRQSLYSL